MKTFFKTIGALLVLMAAVWVGTKMAGSGRAAMENGVDPSEELVAAERGSIEVIVSATGPVEPAQNVEVKSKASGEIIAMPFGLGDRVEQGALLVELDPDDEQRNVARREAQLASEEARLATAKANLALARSNYERALSSTAAELEQARATLDEVTARYNRQRKLAEEGTISSQELERVRAEFLQAQARMMIAEADALDAQAQSNVVAQREQEILLVEAGVKQARIELAEARERLEETRITAPIAGTVTRTFVNPGQVISSAIVNVGGGTSLLEVSDMSRLFVEASVDEVDIGQVRPGQKATLAADAFPMEKFPGVVRSIAPRGEEVNSVVVFTVKLEVEGDGLEKLRPGMTVNASIEAGLKEDALLLPVHAVRYDDEQPYVVPEGRDEADEENRIYLELGLSDGLNVEVLDGLTEGQKVQLPRRFANRAWSR